MTHTTCFYDISEVITTQHYWPVQTSNDRKLNECWKRSNCFLLHDIFCLMNTVRISYEQKLTANERSKKLNKWCVKLSGNDWKCVSDLYEMTEKSSDNSVRQVHVLQCVLHDSYETQASFQSMIVSNGANWFWSQWWKTIVTQSARACFKHRKYAMIL